MTKLHLTSPSPSPPSAYKIERGVPLPPARGKIKDSFTAALKRMEPGDSIFVKAGEKPSRNGVYSLARWAGVAITLRDEYEDAEDEAAEGVYLGYRVWRVA